MRLQNMKFNLNEQGASPIFIQKYKQTCNQTKMSRIEFINKETKRPTINHI